MAVVQRGDRSLETALPEDDEDGIGKSEGNKVSRGLTGPPAPLEYGPREKTRTAVVPLGDKDSRLRGAEPYYPPCFRRSVAESGTGPWPGQG
ncbi:hypothetical protein NDU88_000091 [Pleurodeles waltl]|uniref:Uncharacterized protein n=1 Tax=Pleurodeles waltl TaxID=8319 RepID=A0AAV7UT28_PLEWA|nr:hypothetical protein NDU88_000091 [Pleurodeles waltl]